MALQLVCLLLLPTLGSAASAVGQLSCTDTECVSNCDNQRWNILQCYNTTGGNSQIFTSCDGSGVKTITYSGPSCTGQGTSGQMDVAKCLVSETDTSFINTCVDGYAFAAENRVEAQALSSTIRKPNILRASASAVAQLSCTDTGCVEDCTNSNWNINECYNTTGGNSQIFLSCDGNGVQEIVYTGSGCTGQGTTGQMDVAKCLLSETNTSFINTCVTGYAVSAKNGNMKSSTLLRDRAFAV